MNFKELGARLGLEEDEYRELVELFVDTGAADFARLQDAVQAGDLDQVIRSAHTLAGAAGNLGLMDIHKLAKQIENNARDGHTDTMAGDVDQLKGLMDQVTAFVGT